MQIRADGAAAGSPWQSDRRLHRDRPGCRGAHRRALHQERPARLRRHEADRPRRLPRLFGARRKLHQAAAGKPRRDQAAGPGQGRLEHDPEKWVPVFPKRSCSNRKLEPNSDSNTNDKALVPSPAPDACSPPTNEARQMPIPDFASAFGALEAPPTGLVPVENAPEPTCEPRQAAALPNAFAPARRISAENSRSFTARASTIAPTIPLIVASAFSRRAAAERPVTNVVRTSMKSRRPLVKVARTDAGWRTASAARQAIAQPRPAPSRWRADR